MCMTLGELIRKHWKQIFKGREKKDASTGNRTRAARVAGEQSTTEPSMLTFGQQYVQDNKNRVLFYQTLVAHFFFLGVTLFSTTAETFFFLSQATGWLCKVREQHCVGEANSIHDLSWAKWRNPDKNMFLNSLERSNTDTSVKKEICTPSSRSWTSDLWISYPLYSPPLYQLSYRRCHNNYLSRGE